MGACQSSQDGDEEEKKKRSRLIDAKLLEDERRLKKECKILLLGTKELLPDLTFFRMLGFLFADLKQVRERVASQRL